MKSSENSPTEKPNNDRGNINTPLVLILHRIKIKYPVVIPFSLKAMVLVRFECILVPLYQYVGVEREYQIQEQTMQLLQQL